MSEDVRHILRMLSAGDIPTGLSSLAKRATSKLEYQLQIEALLSAAHQQLKGEQHEFVVSLLTRLQSLGQSSHPDSAMYAAEEDLYRQLDLWSQAEEVPNRWQVARRIIEIARHHGVNAKDLNRHSQGLIGEC
ncbi:hypothetical protein [Lyngbya confervoides]|uniref:Uncharacterized protein n=1 Tax=Lyngbya confervoides BDU141951 TaxID=1574623 RepID=A0ABD4T063_9CYAN|nr:hypothetical protein [Lyngbya confervoides]MCM1981795.1 hypothetical protein [Lyngbya confervoides BDU141951]